MRFFKILLTVLAVSFLFTSQLISQVKVWEKKISEMSTVLVSGISSTEDGYTFTTGSFMGIAAFGNIQLVSTGGKDIFLAKYDPDGNLLWVKNYGGINNDEGYNVSVDKDGNCYLTGYFMGTVGFDNNPLVSSGSEDIFIAKYTSNGDLIWVRKSGGSNTDCGYGVAVDKNGNSYLTGYFKGTASFGNLNLISGGEEDVFISKYDPEGVFLWAKRCGGINSDEGFEISVDLYGNCFISGFFGNQAVFGNIILSGPAPSNAFITKFDPYGNCIWAKYQNINPSSTFYFNTTIGSASDIYGNFYFTGSFSDSVTFGNIKLSSNGNNDVYIAKYSTDGNLIWVRQAGGDNWDSGSNISVDNKGSVFLSGFFTGTANFGNTHISGFESNDKDIFIAKYNSAGNLIWVKQTGGAAYSSDYNRGISLDESGNIFTAINRSGYGQYVSRVSDAKLSLLSPLGSEQWQIGTRQTISWYTNLSIVMLQLSTDGGISWADVNSTPIDGNLSGYSITVPNKPSTDCRVRIYSPEFSSAADTSGGFTITNSEVPTLMITSPNGLEKWKIGTEQRIVWNTTAAIEPLTIEFTSDGGATWNLISGNTISNQGNYKFIIPQIISNKCRIRIKLNSNNNIYDISDYMFTMLPEPKILSPNTQADTLKAGIYKDITWSAPMIEDCFIYYTINNSRNWKSVLTNSNGEPIKIDATAGKYSWLVPTILTSDSCKVKIVDADDSTLFDESDSLFTIYNPILITYPNNGEIFQAGNTYNIRWTTIKVKNIKIEYHQYGNDNCEPPYSNNCDTVLFRKNNIGFSPYDATLGEYTWIVPDIPHKITKIRITDTQNPNTYSVSEAFEVVPMPSPDSLHIQFINNSVKLSWKDMTGYEDGFKVERKSGPGAYKEIASLNANITSYADNTIVPAQLSTYVYRIKAFNQYASSQYKEISINISSTENANELPKTFAIDQNYPNPFNPATLIRFSLPKESSVKLKVYNALGEVISELFDGIKSVGFHEVNFNAVNLSSGIYFYVFEAHSSDGKDNFNQIRKMMLLK